MAGTILGALIVLGAIIVWAIFARKRARTRRLEGNALSFGPEDDVFRPPLDDGDDDDLDHSPGHSAMAERPRGGGVAYPSPAYGAIAGTHGRKRSGERAVLIDEGDEVEEPEHGVLRSSSALANTFTDGASSMGHYYTAPTTPVPAALLGTGSTAARRRPGTGDSAGSQGHGVGASLSRRATAERMPTLGFGQAGETMWADPAAYAPIPSPRGSPTQPRSRKPSGLDPGLWLGGKVLSAEQMQPEPGSPTLRGQSSAGHYSRESNQGHGKNAKKLFSFPDNSGSVAEHGSSLGGGHGAADGVRQRTPDAPSSHGHGDIVRTDSAQYFDAPPASSSHGHGSSGSEAGAHHFRQLSVGSHDGFPTTQRSRSAMGWAEVPPSAYRDRDRKRSAPLPSANNAAPLYDALAVEVQNGRARSPTVYLNRGPSAKSSRSSLSVNASGGGGLLSRALPWRRRSSRVSVAPQSLPSSSQDVPAYFARSQRSTMIMPSPPEVPTFFQSPGTPRPVSPPASHSAPLLISHPTPAALHLRRPHSPAQLRPPTIADLAASERGDGWAPWPTLSQGLTLPPLPSPMEDERADTPEGLLDARRLGMGRDRNESSAAISLRDHEDYSRPIGAVSCSSSSVAGFD